MSPRSKTVADAIADIESLANELKVHVAEQKVINESFMERIVTIEKESIRTDGKLDRILDNLEKSRNNWQVWIGISVPSIMSFAGLMYMIFGGTK